MLTPETALQKIKQLSPEQQKQVFQLIETLEKQADDPDETSTEEAIAGITQGLKEALNGQTLPLSQMWEGIEREDFFAIADIWENRDMNTETLRQEAWKEQNK